MSKPETIDDYLALVPEPYRIELQRIRDNVHRLVTGATEKISYQMPTICTSRPLISFAAFKDHYSIFPLGGSTLKTSSEELKRHQTGKGTLQFTLEDPISDKLLAEIVAVRVAENDTIASK